LNIVEPQSIGEIELKAKSPSKSENISTMIEEKKYTFIIE
jgi:hypothetical protein